MEEWSGEDIYVYNDTTILLPDNFSLINNSNIKDIVGWSASEIVFSETTLTWLLCITFSVFFLGIATLKYISEHAKKPKVLEKNMPLLSKHLRADEDKAVKSMATKPYPSTEFLRICATHRKHPILFKVEYEMAMKDYNPHSTRHALKEVNDLKNQNRNSIPYDYNRVVLEPIPDVPDSDYINASYVDSLLIPKAYIVTQGPKENTIEDFWRLVWQEKARMIIMLTKTFDFIKVMCVQYWPAAVGITDTYQTIKVELLKEEQLASFMIRTFKLFKLGQPEGREIVQFHFTEWTSHSNPFCISLLEFRRRIRLFMDKFITPADGPTIVHCSDGGGRTGVYLTVDSNLELHEEDGKFDIYGYVKKLRQARPACIEKLDQYKFIYDTLEEFLFSGYSFFPVSELSQRLKQKSLKIDGSKNEYQLEFEKISRMTTRFSIGDCAGGHRADNRFKNRNVLCVPPDNFRPYLTSFQGNTCTDYINSVFVDGYSRIKEYIVTEWPVRSTMADVWSLVYDHDVTSVVVLHNPTTAESGFIHHSEYIVTEWPTSNTVQDIWSLVFDYECCAIVVLCDPIEGPNYPIFWPDKQKSVKYGPVFTIDHVSHQHFQNIRSWVFKISKKTAGASRKMLSTVVDEVRGKNIVSLTELMAGIKAEPKTCQLFQLLCWPQGHKVPTSTNALVELMNMVERWRQKSNHGPVLVISPDGMARAGVYCAANACIEQVIQHGEVDVFQAVKTVRLHRPQLVNNITEYKYCYDVVLHYVLHFLQSELANE